MMGDVTETARRSPFARSVLTLVLRIDGNL